MVTKKKKLSIIKGWQGGWSTSVNGHKQLGDCLMFPTTRNITPPTPVACALLHALRPWSPSGVSRSCGRNCSPKCQPALQETHSTRVTEAGRGRNQLHHGPRLTPAATGAPRSPLPSQGPSPLAACSRPGVLACTGLVVTVAELV